MPFEAPFVPQGKQGKPGGSEMVGRKSKPAAFKPKPPARSHHDLVDGDILKMNLAPSFCGYRRVS